MKKFLSVTLVLLFCCLSFLATDLKADAAVVTVQTVSDGETWRQSWSSSVESMVLKADVNYSDFYEITVNDYKQTGCFYISIYDLTLNEYVGAISKSEVLATYVSKPMLLNKDHIYELECYYTDQSGELSLDADLAVTLNKSLKDIPDLPTCPLNSSNIAAQFTEDDSMLWLEYTPAQSGDYTLYFENLHAFVALYSAAAERLTEIDSEYYDGNSENWYVKDGLVFTLKAGTKYYFQINSYEPASSRLSVVKNSKDVKSIVAHEQLYTIDSFYDSSVNDSDFSYKVTYTDRSTEIFPRVWLLEARGYEAPFIEYAGEYSYIDDEAYLVPGKQPVYSIYNGTETKIYVNILSITGSMADYEPAGEYDICSIEYEGEGEYAYWWHVKVASSGYYGLWRYNTDDFATNFKNFSINFVDENNQVVPFNQAESTYYLAANKEYALRFEYEYNPSYSYNDIEFWLQKKYTPNGWENENGKWAYYDNGVRLKSCWKNDSAGWCYLGADGYMMTNAWIPDSVGLCRVDGSGYMVRSQWVNDGIGWRYVDASGYVIYNQWQKDSVGWCYVGEDGYMYADKWHYDSVGLCYIGSGGYCITNQWKEHANGWIYFDANGSQTKNSWMKKDTDWLYLGSNGFPLKNQWKNDSAGWCYLGADGVMVTDAWIPDSHGLCRVDASGYMVYSKWINDGIGWRYVDASGYVIYNQWQKDSIGWCYVGEDGYMYADKWHHDSVGLCYIGSNGYCITNQWKKHANGWVYFNANGSQVKNTTIDGYRIGADGFRI